MDIDSILALNTCASGILICSTVSFGILGDIPSTPGDLFSFIYTIILLKSVCLCSQTAGRNSCSIVSGDVSNCSYHLTIHPLTSSRVSSA